MTTLTEGNHGRDFLVSYAGQRCFEEITIASGENLDQGAVLGQLTKRQAAAPIPTCVGTGNGLMSALSFGPRAKVGAYVATIATTAANGGTFTVVNPDGDTIGTATVGTAFDSDEIRFTIADGTADFVAADKFTVTLTAGGTPVCVGTGNGAMSAITIGQDAQLGTYRVVCDTASTHTATFKVIRPDGAEIKNSVDGLFGYSSSGGADSFVSREVNFTITDGTTDIVVGDYFNIVVATGTGQYKAWSSTATDGTQDVAGVLLEATNATSASVDTVGLMRDAEVNASELTWRSGYTAGQKARGIAGLAKLGIIARTADDA